MSTSGNEEIVTLAYGGEQFRFVVVEQTEDLLRGRFCWSDDEKRHLLMLLDQEEEEGGQPWYLDDDGHRLDDERLFELSPWSIIGGDKPKKAVQRFMDCDTGQASFCVTPWIQIGDWL